MQQLTADPVGHTPGDGCAAGCWGAGWESTLDPSGSPTLMGLVHSAKRVSEGYSKQGHCRPSAPGENLTGRKNRRAPGAWPPHHDTALSPVIPRARAQQLPLLSLSNLPAESL